VSGVLTLASGCNASDVIIFVSALGSESTDQVAIRVNGKTSISAVWAGLQVKQLDDNDEPEVLLLKPFAMLEED